MTRIICYGQDNFSLLRKREIISYSFGFLSNFLLFIYSNILVTYLSVTISPVNCNIFSYTNPVALILLRPMHYRIPSILMATITSTLILQLTVYSVMQQENYMDDHSPRNDLFLLIQSLVIKL